MDSYYRQHRSNSNTHQRASHPVIATNQSGVNREIFSKESLQHIHQKMRTLIENAGGKIEKIYFCPHRPDENCLCRKPKPGLLHQIQRDFQVPFSEMIFVGDSDRDWEAAKAVGCPFVLLRTGNGEKTAKLFTYTEIYDNLLAFAEKINRP